MWGAVARLSVPATLETEEKIMRLLERPDERIHRPKTTALFQQAAESDPETTQDAADQFLALGTRAVSNTVSADPTATLGAILQKSSE